MRTLTMLALLLLAPAALAAPEAEEIGPWRLICAEVCRLSHKDWVAPPSPAMPGLALEVEARDGLLVPVIAARDLPLQGALRGLLALGGEATLRFSPGDATITAPCALDGRSLICAPRAADAGRAATLLPEASQLRVTVSGLTAGSSSAWLRLSDTRTALVRLRMGGAGLSLAEIIARLRDWLGR